MRPLTAFLTAALISAVFIPSSLTQAAENPIRILVVAGHDRNSIGGMYRGMPEEILTRSLGRRITEALSADPRFSVVTLRDGTTGAYTDFFARYVSEHYEELQRFRDTHDAIPLPPDANLTEDGTEIHHGHAPSDARLRLYAVNKWAGEHDIGLVLHLHFNDYSRGRIGNRSPGAYKGFALYVPPVESPIAKESIAVANILLKRLGTIAPVSNLDQEKRGIIPDAQLLATYGRGSAIVPNVLIEYGYMYEPQISNRNINTPYFEAMTAHTVRALEEYFFGTARPYSTASFRERLSALWPGKKGEDVVALQLVLAAKGFYPPAGKSFSECRITGSYGPCTSAAIKEFQRANKLNVTGMIGPYTLSLLRKE